MIKNSIIIILGVSLLISVSYIYKISNKHNFYGFPTNILERDSSIETPLYIIVFFSKSNCRDCLEVIDVVNRLIAPFIVYGVVPNIELKNEKELRNQTGAKFKLIGLNSLKKFAPLYGPSIMGVTEKGRILFIIPGIPGIKTKLEENLTSLYYKAYLILKI